MARLFRKIFFSAAAAATAPLTVQIILISVPGPGRQFDRSRTSQVATTAAKILTSSDRKVTR